MVHPDLLEAVVNKLTFLLEIDEAGWVAFSR
jgi:hypothetical protein